MAPVWKIGELARRTGLTVRTLHHYDEIGLLSPAQRSDGGHRVYDEPDVQRLYRIVSLRSLGFPLDAIAQALDSQTFDAREAVDDHLRRLEAQLAQEQQMLDKLRMLRQRVDADDFLTTIEEITMRERYYTPEQLDQLELRRQDSARTPSRTSSASGARSSPRSSRGWAGALIPPTRASAPSPTARAS